MVIGRAEVPLSGAGPKSNPTAFEYQEVPGNGLRARIVFPAYLEAQLQFGGDSIFVAAADKDGNGKYGDAADLWTLTSGQSWGSRPQSEYALSALDEGRFQDGFRYTLQVGGDLRVQLHRAAAKEPWSADLAGHRQRIEEIWADRFGIEGAGIMPGPFF